ncbi:MAG: DUF928 domain-containing protein [Leptolyngbyaceae cyanobacterium]
MTTIPSAPAFSEGNPGAIAEANLHRQDSLDKQQGNGDWGNDILGDQVGAGPRLEDWGEPHDGNQTGAGTRETCPQTDYPLVALMPEGVNWSLTTQSYPTFWFYLPYTRDQVATAIFVLEDETGVIYHELPIVLPEEPGFYRFTIPNNLPPLQAEVEYFWALKLFCSLDSIVPIFVNGEVEFAEVDATLQSDYQAYIDDRIWLDAVNLLMQQRIQEPDNLDLFKDWQRLMLSGGITPEEVPAMPIYAMPLPVSGGPIE